MRRGRISFSLGRERGRHYPLDHACVQLRLLASVKLGQVAHVYSSLLRGPWFAVRFSFLRRLRRQSPLFARAAGPWPSRSFCFLLAVGAPRTNFRCCEEDAFPSLRCFLRIRYWKLGSTLPLPIPMGCDIERTPYLNVAISVF